MVLCGLGKGLIAVGFVFGIAGILRGMFTILIYKEDNRQDKYEDSLRAVSICGIVCVIALLVGNVLSGIGEACLAKDDIVSTKIAVQVGPNEVAEPNEAILNICGLI